MTPVASKSAKRPCTLGRHKTNQPKISLLNPDTALPQFPCRLKPLAYQDLRGCAAHQADALADDLNSCGQLAQQQLATDMS